MVGAALIAGLVAGAATDAAKTALGAWAGYRSEKLNQSRFDTQVELANTAHQREVADLRAAGLNPILSTGTAGAAVPQQAAASWENPAGHLTDVLSNAVALEKGVNEIDRIGQETTLLKAQTAKEIADANIRKFEAEAINSASGDERQQMVEAVRNEVKLRGFSGNPLTAVQNASRGVYGYGSDKIGEISDKIKSWWNNRVEGSTATPVAPEKSAPAIPVSSKEKTPVKVPARMRHETQFRKSIPNKRKHN